jgi:hypothetical protein
MVVLTEKEKESTHLKPTAKSIMSPSRQFGNGSGKKLCYLRLWWMYFLYEKPFRRRPPPLALNKAQ